MLRLFRLFAFLLILIQFSGCIRYYAGAPEPFYLAKPKEIDASVAQVVHKKTGISLPPDAGLFKRTKALQSDEKGYDLRASYERLVLGRLSEASVTLYPALAESSLGGGKAYTNLQNEAFLSERQRLIAQIEQDEARFKFVGETKAPFLNGSAFDTRLIYAKKDFRLDQPGITTLAYLYFIDNWFLRIRYKTSDLELDQAEREADAFVQQIVRTKR